jgi:hypothetical protein
MGFDWKKWISELNFEHIFKSLVELGKDWFKDTLPGKAFGLLQKAPTTVLTGDSAKQAAEMFAKIDKFSEQVGETAAAEAARIAKAKVAELNPPRLAGGESATAPAPQTPPMVPKPAASTERAPA